MNIYQYDGTEKAEESESDECVSIIDRSNNNDLTTNPENENITLEEDIHDHNHWKNTSTLIPLIAENHLPATPNDIRPSRKKNPPRWMKREVYHFS